MRSWLGLLIVALGLCGRAWAGEPCWGWWRPWCPLEQHCPCCPDDYCKKPLPLLCPVRSCGPDDYCPKPLPLTSPLKCGGVDDYCPNAGPIHLPPCYPPWYTCRPAN